jgi:AraC-like DNA-binding protein
MHLVFRLTDEPLLLYTGEDDEHGETAGVSVVGGARAAPYIRDISKPSSSIGAMLHPGAGELLFRRPATELAGRHTSLTDLWDREAELLRERLLEAESPEAKLALFEKMFLAKLPRVRGLNPAIAHAIGRLHETSEISEVVRETGYSHRSFLEMFKNAVGLTPKLYCRVLRFHRALERAAAEPKLSWAELAFDAGYSDQPHFNREFRELSGISPGEYRRTAPAEAMHVALAPSRKQR